jgi:4-hydroxybenzoate polyprenyltransferase
MEASSTTGGPSPGDIPVGGWIDRHVPEPARPYLRLMRLDRPIGTWLLLFPCWWSVALAAKPWPNLWLMILFAVGAIVMRGAGCTVNDIADRDIDARVARTRSRPIPSGEVSVAQAAALLAGLLIVGLLILLQLNRFAIVTGIVSLLLVFPYPFMKRITWWPQAWLGLTFNWGALLGWAAVTGGLAWPPILLYAAGILWTLGYDTIYALQDKEDDALVGVKSSALRLGSGVRQGVAIFYAGTIVVLAATGWAAGLSWLYGLFLLGAAAQAAWQVVTLDIAAPADCLAKFRSNQWFAWLVLAGLVIGRFQ